VEDFTADAGDGSAYISYHISARSDAGGLSILYTIIYQDGVEVAQTTDTYLQVTGLTNGRTYYFSAAWHNEVGTGQQTAPVMVIPLGVPGAPVSLSATMHNKAVNLTWAAPSETGGAIDSYAVYQDGTYIGKTSQTYYLINNLENGRPYQFAVAANNSMWQSVKATIPATPTPDPAGVPTGLTATPGNEKVDLAWAAPADNGGATIDHYVIYQDGVALTTTAPGTTATISELLPGQQYSFAVAAHNSAGLSVKSIPITAIPYTLPNAPTGLMAVPGNEQVTLNWTAPAYNGGSAVDYYVVYQDGVALTYQQSGPVAIINALVNGQSYTFTVAAHNLAGIGAQSVATVSVPVAIPDAPTGLTAVPGHLQITLNWTAPLSNGGTAIDSYFIYQNGVVVQQTTETSFTITGLTSGQAYDYAVSARNGAGEGPRTTTVSAAPRPALTSPGAPEGLTATPGDGKVDLAWALPADNGGAPIDYYVVYQNDIEIIQVTGNSWSVTGLLNGQSYSYSIASHNSMGLSAKSAPVLAMPYTIPGAPAGLTATPGNEFVTLTWTAPSNNGGAAIDHYVVYQDGVVLSINPTGLTFAITGLLNGQSYNFTLAAHNPAGTGPTTYAVAIPTKTVPSEPLNVSVSTIDSGIVLDWSAPSDNGGYPVSYSILRGTSAGTESMLANTSVNSYTDRAIVLGTNYYYYVKAVNQLGSSIPSKETGPIYASTAVRLDMETESSSSIGALVTLTGSVVTVNAGMPIEGLSISLSYSTTNGLSWSDISSVSTSVKGSFSTQWNPHATGIFMVKAAWAGNAIYLPSTSIKSLAITETSDKYVFTVQSNSTITDLSFNSESEKLSFNVSGETGTNGYSRIVISKDLVANGSEIRLSMDGKEMSYKLNSTESSWILYFEYHHSTHSIVASLGEVTKTGSSNLSDSPLPIVAITGLAVVSVMLIAGLVLFNRRRARK
jgi:titin